MIVGVYEVLLFFPIRVFHVNILCRLFCVSVLIFISVLFLPLSEYDSVVAEHYSAHFGHFGWHDYFKRGRGGVSMGVHRQGLGESFSA